MDKEETRLQWMAALLSGDYKQETGSLQTKRGFCCLGVGCDLYASLEGEGEWKDVQGERGAKRFRLNDQTFGVTGYPPQDVCDWLGIDNRQVHDLASKNDKGASFDEIAGLIYNMPIAKGAKR